MIKRRIALINYPFDYFRSFGVALEKCGFEVFWVHITRSAARFHREQAPSDAERVLDSTEGLVPRTQDIDRLRNELLALEAPGGPKIYDIILMDRMLRNKSQDFALCYLGHLSKVLTTFFTANGIELVTSGRDSALQLMAMLVCRRLNVPWVVPTRARIPQEMYMFTSGHETESIIPVREPADADRVWATEFLRSFRAQRQRPALKAAARGFRDVLRMVPRHVRLFALQMRTSGADLGNDFSRYSVRRLITMYVRRRLNLLMFKLFPPYVALGQRPFCVYALHTQPESSIDVCGSHFSDQVALVTFIVRSLPCSHELYVKIHPTDVDGKSLAFYRRIAQLPGVRLINFDVDSRELIDRASIVFTLTGTIGYEAALLGRPVITFARNYYNAMPTVHYCDSPPKLAQLVASVLARTAPDTTAAAIEFLARLRAASFPGEVNRMYLPGGLPLTADDLTNLQQAYLTLHDSLCVSVDGRRRQHG